MSAWTFDDIPDQTGRVAVVTGANSGIGWETAVGLARKGAHVVLACRSPEKGEDALARLRATNPSGTAELARLDLSDLDSVRAFADGFGRDRIDLLVNNAGVMAPPYGKTKQGFETQIGTNHLGHFALAGRLLPKLVRTPGARVVVVASGVHHTGRVDLDDLHYTRRRYVPFMAYAQSKLANLLYALELQRRLDAARLPLRVTAAHPGWTATELQRTSAFAQFWNPILAMKPPEGALPTLRAATDPEAGPATYWGPSGWFEMAGPPVPARINAKARDEAVAARLWAVSEEATGVCYAFAAEA
jgi:NAD(P)-dependent dehydrogenase (short-subunit alcohol dehydrogenase family)